MPDCTHYDALSVQRYYDGEMATEAAVAFEAHLSECRECGASLSAWGGIGDGLRALPAEAWAARSTEDLVRRAKERQMESTRHVAWGLLAAASLLLLTSLSLVGYSQAGQADVPEIMAQWEEYVVAPPVVDEDFSDVESRTLVAIHLKAAAGEN